MSILQEQYFGNTVLQWIIAASTAIVVLAILKCIQWFVVKRIAKFAKNTETEIDDMFVEVIKKTHVLSLIIAGIYFGANTLSIPPETRLILKKIFTLALVIQGGVWVGAAITFWLQRTIKRRLVEDAAGATTL
ncbi:MAG: hypothetical protein ABI623_08585, partial [bacterium]